MDSPNRCNCNGSGVRVSYQRSVLAILFILTLLPVTFYLNRNTKVYHIPRPRFSTVVTSRQEKARDIISPGKNLFMKIWDKNVFSDVVPTFLQNTNQDEPTDMGLTSHKMSNVRLISPKEGNITVGDIVIYRIQSRDSKGRNRITGGDFWFATLSATRGTQGSSAGYIVDHNNGTYDVYLLAAWSGAARFDLILVYVSEAVHYLRDIVWHAEDRTQWIGNFVVNGKMVETRCFLRSGGAWTDMCEYPAFHALGNTVFICQKKPNIPCKSLISYRSNWDQINARVDELTKGYEYLFKSPYYMEHLPISNNMLQIKGSEMPPYELHRCKPDQTIPAIQGYWKGRKWNSLLCRFSKYTKQALHTCLRGKELILMGDSTTLRIFHFICKLLDIKPSKVINNKGPVELYSRKFFNTLNLIVYYQFHPDRLGTLSYNRADMRYEVDVLDGLNSTNCGYIIIVSPWAHFAHWKRDSYIERVRRLRNAVVRFKQRCPNVRVVIRGPHATHHDNYPMRVTIPDYLMKEIEHINEEAFEGTGAYFLPVWDMNLAYPAPNILHEDNVVIRDEVNMILGYVCEGY